MAVARQQVTVLQMALRTHRNGPLRVSPPFLTGLMEYIDQQIVEGIKVEHNVNVREQNWADAGRALRMTNNILGGESVWEVVLANTKYCVDCLADGEEYMKVATIYLLWREWVPRYCRLFDDYCVREERIVWKWM